jgi:hypothetical protein
MIHNVAIASPPARRLLSPPSAEIFASFDFAIAGDFPASYN